jgi:hypothetical protein
MANKLFAATLVLLIVGCASEHPPSLVATNSQELRQITHLEPNPSRSTLTTQGERKVSPSPQPISENIPIIDRQNVDARTVMPSFDRKQTDEEIERILADGKPHSITILFEDRLGIRVKQANGSALANNNNGLIATNEQDPSFQSIKQVLSRHRLRFISPISLASHADEHALREKQERDSATLGFMMPNAGSWAVLGIEDYSASKAKDLVKTLQNLPGVRIAEVEPELTGAAVAYSPTPTDPLFPPTSDWRRYDYNNTARLDSAGNYAGTWWWNRHSIGLAWAYNKGTGVKVAVVDGSFQQSGDGINWDNANKRHYYKDVQSQTYVQYNNYILPESRDTGNGGWHGTVVATMIGAASGNGIDASGIAPGALILPIKVDYDAQCIAAGIHYAIEQGAQVINLSLTSPNTNLEAFSVIREAMTAAWAAGITVVYCAGNDEAPIGYDPALYTGAICVGGINKENNPYLITHGNGSSFGSRVDLAAAAQHVTITKNSTVYPFATFTTLGSGTSISSPLVAGAAAMVRYYTNNVASVRDYLIYSSDWTTSAGATMNSNSGAALSDGTRVLNAGSAVRLAATYNSGYPFQFYRPASVEYTQLNFPDYSYRNEGWFPSNILTSFSGNGFTVNTNDYNNSAYHWAGSSAIFRRQRIYIQDVKGYPYLIDAEGSVIKSSYNTDPTANTKGWVNPRSFALWAN